MRLSIFANLKKHLLNENRFTEKRSENNLLSEAVPVPGANGDKHGWPKDGQQTDVSGVAPILQKYDAGHWGCNAVHCKMLPSQDSAGSPVEHGFLQDFFRLKKNLKFGKIVKRGWIMGK